MFFRLLFLRRGGRGEAAEHNTFDQHRSTSRDGFRRGAKGISEEKEKKEKEVCEEQTKKVGQRRKRVCEEKEACEEKEKKAKEVCEEEKKRGKGRLEN